MTLGLLPFITARRESPWRLFAVLPTAVMTVLVSLQGYYHFAVVRASMFYGAFAAPALALLGAWLIGKISRTSVRLAAGGGATVLCYFLFGAYSAFLTLGLIAGELARRQPCRAARALFPSVFILLSAAVWYFLCAGHFQIDAIGTAGLIRFYEGITDPFTMQISSRLFIAFLALAAAPLLMAIARGAFGDAKDTPPQNPPQEAPASRGGAAGSCLSAVVLALVCLAVQWGSKTDENYLALLAMVRPLEYDQWDKILEIESRCDSPTLPMIDLRRLALAETGQIGQRLFERTNIPVAAPDLVYTEGVRLLGTDLYFRFGSVNHAICFLCNTLRLFPEAPARTPLYFQLLDAEGRAVQSMRSWSTLQPNEFFGCIGCHEPKDSTIDNVATLSQGNQTIALNKGVAIPKPLIQIAEGDDPNRGFSFPKDVQPILDRHCIECHKGFKPPKDAKDENGNPIKDGPFSLLPNPVRQIPTVHPTRHTKKPEDQRCGRVFSEAYLNLTEGGKFEKYIHPICVQDAPPMYPPYYAGSIASPLIDLLRHPDENHKGVKLSEEELRIIEAWIDLVVPYCGTYTESRDWAISKEAEFFYNLMKRKAYQAFEADNIKLMLDVQAGRKSPPAYGQIERMPDFGPDVRAKFINDYVEEHSK